MSDLSQGKENSTSGLFKSIRGLEQLKDWRFVKLKPHDKMPIELDWPNRTYAWGNPDLLKWIGQGGNYGVAGDENHVIIDGDIAAVRAAVEKYLPETFTVKTPGHIGKHYYFIASIGDPVRLRDNDGKNVGDIQGKGKQVVGAGCTHPNGGKYEIIKNIPCASTTKEAICGALAEFIILDHNISAWEGQERKTDISILAIHPPNGMNRRGNEFFGAHPVHGSDTGQNFWMNPVSNVWHCFRHGTGGGPLSLLAVKEGIIKCEDAKPGALRGSVFKTVWEIARKGGIVKRALKKVKDNDFIPAEIAEIVQAKFRFATHKQSHEIWVYKNGVYYPDGEEVIRAETRKLLSDDATDHRVNEIVSHIRDTTFTDPEKFEPSLELINLENGIIDLKVGELRPHTPDVIFTNKLPVKYNPQAKCPGILKFLSEIHHAGDVPVIQEYAGYCLYRKYFLARALMCIGDGANGKSTLLRLIDSLLGKDNVATPPLQSLVYNRFAAAELFGKLANIHADLPPTPLAQTGMFKMLTGGDTIYAERKNRDPFTFINYAKLIYSANTLPQTADLSEAFWRRWLVIEFPHKFPEGDPKTDPHILKKLTAPEELSGFLNWALEGLKRLLENGKFSPSKTIKEVERKWTLQTDGLRAFVVEHVKRDSNYFVIKDDLYAAYQDFCDEHEVEVVGKPGVGRRLPTLVRVLEFRPRIGGQQPRAWRGIRLIEPYGDKNQPVPPVPEKPRNGQNFIRGNHHHQNTLIDNTPKSGTSGSPDTKPTVSDLKRRLLDAFGVKPFKPSQLPEHFTGDELVRLTAIMDDMRERGELMVVPLESGNAMRLVVK